MKPLSSSICSFFMLMASIAVKSQKLDTLFCKAKVQEIDTMGYYVVIRSAFKEKEITIMSPLKERSGIIDRYKDSAKITVGHVYSFVLCQTIRIKYANGDYLLLPIRGDFYYGDKLLLREGELPYIALNMYGFEIYN